MKRYKCKHVKSNVYTGVSFETVESMQIGKSWWGGGMFHWGLYIIRDNPFLKSSLNEDETTVGYPQLSEHYTARAHRGIAPRYPILSADRPQTLPGDL